MPHADGNAGAGQGHRLDKPASVRQKVHGSLLASIACVSLNGLIYPRIPRRLQLSKSSKVALVEPWWSLGGALVEPWWSPGGALVEPWWSLGGALVEPWWSLGVALGWLWGGSVLRSLCLDPEIHV